MNKVINVVRASLPPFEEYVEEISDIWERQMADTYGTKTSAVRKRPRKFFGYSECGIVL